MIFNLLDCELAENAHARDGHRFLRAMLGQAAGAEHTGFSVYELPPGETAWAYHYELNREEWLIVVERRGRRADAGRRGDAARRRRVVLPGRRARARTRCATTRRRPRGSRCRRRGRATATSRCGPDSNTALIVGPGFRRIVPLDDDLGYWEREP